MVPTMHSARNRLSIVVAGGAALLGTSLLVAPQAAQGARPALEPAASTVAATAAAEPIGFASVSGMGLDGTTGGAGGEQVTVSSESEFLQAVEGSDPRVVQVQGTVELSGMNDVGSNKTIVGAGNSAGITGGGLDLDEVQNVIIRNLSFTGADDDMINVQDSSHHVWVDHNTFSESSDGMIDIKRGSDFITVSWNHFQNHDHVALLGHSDDNADQDEGHLRVTYHHNFFDGTYSRHPRVRFGEPVHVFNNYYRNNDGYGVASTMDAGVLVEGNYFENVEHPTYTQYGDSDAGRLVARDNVFDNSGEPETSGSVEEPPYPYTLDDAAEIPSIVSSGAGAGQLNLTG